MMIELNTQKRQPHHFVSRTNSLQKKYLREEKYVKLVHTKYFCNLCNDYVDDKIVLHFKKHHRNIWIKCIHYANLFDEV